MTHVDRRDEMADMRGVERATEHQSGDPLGHGGPVYEGHCRRREQPRRCQSSQHRSALDEPFSNTDKA